MTRIARIGVTLSYLSLAAVPLYGASVGKPIGQNIPHSISTPLARDPSRAESFRSSLQEQQKTLQSYGEEISGLVDRLKAMSGATVESRLAEVRGLRDALVQLGTELQPDAPLSQSIDQYQSWDLRAGSTGQQPARHAWTGVCAGPRREGPNVSTRGDQGPRGGRQPFQRG